MNKEIKKERENERKEGNRREYNEGNKGKISLIRRDEMIKITDINKKRKLNK